MASKAEWILRMDDRLVHGQVCVGWCEVLGIPHLVLADDAIVGSAFERDLYACCPGQDQQLAFMGLEELALAMSTPPAQATLAVIAGPSEALRLLELGAPLVEVLVGGLHDQPGARQVTDYLFVTPAQEESLRQLMARGVHLVGQPLPASPRLELQRLLG
jgi:mannose/fructose/N-acetylgalactosamine-specific phosphotransferase system component IIB